MNVYMIYIKLTKPLYYKYPYLIDDKNIVDEEDDILIAFYAYTTDKSYKNQFMKTRKRGMFYCKKVSISREWYTIFCSEKFLYRLEKNLFGLNEVSVFNEYYECTNYFSEILNLQSISLPKINPNIFNERYHEMLNDIGYCDFISADKIREYEMNSFNVFFICFRELLNDKFLSKILKEI